MSPEQVDALPPTQYLVLDVLAGRHRLGEQVWTFPVRLRPALGALAEAGLIGWKAGIVEGTALAWLTGAGRAVTLAAGYQPAVDVRTEWAVRLPKTGELYVAPEARARRWAAMGADAVGTAEEGAELVSRTVVTSAWQPEPQVP